MSSIVCLNGVNKSRNILRQRIVIMLPCSIGIENLFFVCHDQKMGHAILTSLRWD
jgi:hypothetical protein